MTGYESATVRGRETAHDTNTSFKLRTVVEYREHRTQPDRWGDGTLVGELVGDCGHIVEWQNWPPLSMKKRVGERKRCRACPADQPKPLFRDHCTYGYATELGERPCKNLSRFNDEGGYGLICKRHHDHLLREGYLSAPCRPFEPSRERESPSTSPAFAPELSAPVRGHLRLV